MTQRTTAQRTRTWLAVLVAADLLAWILTLRAHFDFHHSRNGPSVMTIGQLLGWFFSVVLLVLIVVVLLEGRRGRRRSPR
jgi:hypothetical protein